MFSRILKSKAAGHIIAWLIGLYLRLVFATSRWQITNLDRFQDAVADGKGVILAFWHGRLMMMPAVRAATDARIYMLISIHRDGEIIANAVRPFKIDFIRGSAANPKKPEKDKGGASAVGQMVNALSEGQVVGVTPDGPRGPGERSQTGIIKLAQISGSPIIPVGIAASRGKNLNSWDRFFLAAPFSKGHCVAGEAITIEAEIDPETLECCRQNVENALKGVTQAADELAGRSRRDD